MQSYLLKYALYNNSGYIKDVEIIHNIYGKPYINNCKNFYYNILHSGKWVVIVHGKTEVGIDIEEIQDIKEIYDDCFLEEEIKWIYSKKDDKEADRFIKLWTFKESYLKYIGTGLYNRMDSFSVDVENAIIKSGKLKVDENVRFYSYDIDDKYYLTVCGMEEQICFNEVKTCEVFEFIDKIKYYNKSNAILEEESV